jgi:hypothetical protein
LSLAESEGARTVDIFEPLYFSVENNHKWQSSAKTQVLEGTVFTSQEDAVEDFKMAYRSTSEGGYDPWDPAEWGDVTLVGGEMKKIKCHL